jgi:hypothetical protein
MTNEDNIPIWAKILLGIPVTGEATNDSRPEQPADCQQSSTPIGHKDETQHVLTFAPSASRRKPAWRSMLCPVPGKLRP